MSASPQPDRIGRLARAWVSAAVRFAPAVVVLTVLTVVPMTWYTAGHLGVDTSTADMIAANLPWRQDFSEYRQAFPRLDHTLIAVIDAPDADHADEARDALHAAMVSRGDLFDDVYAPGSDVFFRRNAFLYLETAELVDVSDRLAAVQPFLAQLAADPTAAGLYTGLTRAMDAGGDEIDLSPMLERIARVVELQNRGEPGSLSWQSLMSDRAAEPVRRIVVLKPRLDFAQLQPARAAIDAVREQERLISEALPGSVRIRLTGPVALEYEELISVTRGARLAGLLALVAVLVILYFGLRSGWLIAAATLTLLTGLLATAAFAALAVGSLNLISIAFAVLYIGLGIDFAIHYCLRYREALSAGADKKTALIDSAGDVGASLVLCAVTTSIGFFAFFPTTFRGVSELGLISGTGMYISLVATLTLLPALLVILPAPARRATNAPFAAATRRIIGSRALLPVAAVLTLAALAALPFARFDSDPVNLRDAQSESVSTYFDLLADPLYSPRSLAVVVADAGQVAVIEKRLDGLAAVTAIDVFLPDNQDEKLGLVEELNWLVGPALEVNASAAPDATRDRAAIRELLDRLREREEGARLAAALTGFLSDATNEDYAELEKRLVGTLPGRLASLNDALDAGPVTLADLPDDLRERWISEDGRYRVELRPLHDDTDFVAEVREIAPRATGLPVVQREAGLAVVGAFRQAFVTAIVLICAILLFLLRSWRQTLVVLVPLAAASLATIGVMVSIGQSFNFANVIALPLLLGVGVDNGIHMVHRWRGAGTGEDLLQSSTSRAIWFSALTTIASFGNLAFSGHPGSASMGRVLTIGMIFTTLSTILLIPALLARLRR